MIKHIVGELKGGGSIRMYDVTTLGGRLVLGDAPMIETNFGDPFPCEVVEASDDGVLVKCRDDFTKEGYVHVLFSGKHDPRPRPPIPESSAGGSGRCTVVVKSTSGPEWCSITRVPESSASVAPFKVGDRVRTTRHPKGEGTVSAVHTDVHGGYSVRLDIAKGQSLWFGAHAVERIPATKAEPPLTVTAERICPQQFVMDMTEVIHAHECKSHGSEQFERLASDLEQVRVLARANWIASLPSPRIGETIGDYAARANILPPKPGKRHAWEVEVFDIMLYKIPSDGVLTEGPTDE